MSYQFPQPQGQFNPYAQQPQFQQPQFPPQQQGGPFGPFQQPPQDMFGPPPGGMMGMPPAIGGSGSIRQHESGGFADDSNGNLNSGGGIFSLKNAVIATVLTGSGLLFAKWMGWIGGGDDAKKTGGDDEAKGNDDDHSEVGPEDGRTNELDEEDASRMHQQQDPSTTTTVRSEQS